MTTVCCWCGAALGLGQVLDLEAWLCPTETCWRRQVKHALTVQAKKQSRATCANVPLPKQVEFRERPEKYVLFGGAAGPGKSHEARWALYEKCLTIPGFEALLLRETFGELERTHMRRMEAEQDQIGAVFTPSAHIMRFPNKSLIEVGHMEDAAAVRKYLSTEYDAIVPDEGALYDPDAILSLSTRARSKKPGVLAAGGPKFWVVTNPGGPASQVLLDFFIDHTPDFDVRPQLRDKYDPSDWAFVPALLDDNPYIDPNYDAALAVEKPHRYQQLRYGNFRVFAGQFFPAWREDRHVRSIALPDGCRYFRSCDWGYNAPGCVLWWAVLPDGHLHIVSDLKFQQDDVAEVKKKILARDKQLGIKGPIALYGDPNMQAKIGLKSTRGASIAEALGCGYQPADNDRFNGWTRCHQILRDDAAGEPWLTVDPSCRYLIRSIPAAKSDKNNLDDLDTNTDDHACLIGETVVRTTTGWTPLAMMGLTDTVWTREGWKPVEAVAITQRDAPLRRVDFSDGTSLTGTDNHPVFVVDRGFVQLDTLRYGDTIARCPDGPLPAWNPSSTAASHSEDIPTPRASKISATTSRAAATFAAAWNRCIGKSGKTPTGRFQTAAISIIATAIRATITSIIWPVSLPPRMARYTEKGQPRLLCWNTWRPFALSPWRGIDLMPAVAGMASTPLRRSSTAFLSSKCAPCADASIKTSRDALIPASVPTTAAHNGGATPTSMTSTVSASAVVEPSALIGIPKASPVPRPAPHVVASSPAGTGTVYNLTVADCHEYYANGVLVHNCDAWRYGAMSRPAPRVSTSSTRFAPGTLGAIKAQQNRPLGPLSRRRAA